MFRKSFNDDNEDRVKWGSSVSTQLRNNARRQLHARELLVHRNIESILHIYVEGHDLGVGPFSQPTSWFLFYQLDETPSGKPLLSPTPFVERVMWNHHEDWLRTIGESPNPLTPEPTLHIDTIALDKDKFDAVLQEGKNTPVPLVGVSSSKGARGLLCTLRVGGKWVEYTIHWEGLGPEEWNPFTNWVFNLLFFLDEAIFAQIKIRRPEWTPRSYEKVEDDDSPTITSW